MLTATATDGSDNTSEFSGNVEVMGTLAIDKRAFTPGGSPIADAANAPKGSLVKFLIYVNNTGAALNDVSVQDILAPGFAYQAGTIKFDNAVAACAAGDCTPAEEAAIFASADGQAPGTDPVDGDVVSYLGASTTIDAGNGNQANAQLDMLAGRVWAMVLTVRVR